MADYTGFYIALALFSFAILIGLGRYLHDAEQEAINEDNRVRNEAEEYKQRLYARRLNLDGSRRNYSSEPASAEIQKSSSN